MRNPRSTTVGLILAGGKGSRMGGQDKGLIEWRGLPLIEHTYSRLAPQLSTIMISANRNLTDYQRFGVTVLTDTEQNYSGPIAGICRAITHIKTNPSEFNQTSALLVTPCDTPMLPQDLAVRLCADMEQQGCDVSVVFDGSRVQNLHCLIGANVWHDLEDFYAQGKLALRDWFTRVDTSQVDFSNSADAFKNLNRITELD